MMLEAFKVQQLVILTGLLYLFLINYIIFKL